MSLSIISLIVLVVVVAIGFIRKVNLGFLSIGVAFALGTFGGMSAKRDCGRIQQFHVCDFGGCYVPVWYGIQ